VIPLVKGNGSSGNSNTESGVYKLLSSMKQEKANKEKRNRGKEQRFTVTLSEYDFRRLKYIAKDLGLLRSTFARKILIEALNDAEKVLGLTEYDYERPEIIDGEEFYPQTEYGRYLEFGGNDDGDEDEGDEDKPKGAPRMEHNK
jgi:hypothetical protein